MSCHAVSHPEPLISSKNDPNCRQGRADRLVRTCQRRAREQPHAATSSRNSDATFLRDVSQKHNSPKQGHKMSRSCAFIPSFQQVLLAQKSANSSEERSESLRGVGESGKMELRATSSNERANTQQELPLVHYIYRRYKFQPQ